MNPIFYVLIGLAAGAVLFGLIRWLLFRVPKGAIALANSRDDSAVNQEALVGELRQQIARREGELVGLRSNLMESESARAAAEAKREAAEKMLTEQRALHESALVDAKAAQDKALADLRDAFKALSADALKQTAPEFLRLAEQSFGKFQETAKGDLAQRQEAIKGLVEPLKQQLETYQKSLQQSETAQADTLGKVKEQLTALAASSQSLAAETAQFRSVLKSNQARGRWGEETLRRVVEAAGMSAHCDFTEQKAGDDLDKRPDLIVKLPGDRFIIVDAKVPDLDFLSALESADPATRAASLAAHAGKLKATIKALADRDYPRQFPHALDYVVLFVPADYATRFAAGTPAPLLLVADSADSQARKNVDRIKSLLTGFGSEIAQVRLQIRGIDPLIALPIAVDDVDIATPTGKAVVILGFMTYFVLFAMLMGGLYLAIDCTAGER